MSRKKHRLRDKQPKPPITPEPTEVKELEEDLNITRYKAVVRSPLGEWWFENKKRVRLIAIIVVVGVVVGWLLFNLFGMIF